MPTNCPYCRTVNDGAESRCARCGRRLHPAGAGPGTSAYGGSSNAATALALDPDRAPWSYSPPPPVTGEAQPSLFQDLPSGAKVVPIPTLSPLRPASPLDRESVRRNAARSARSPRPHTGMQHSLDLREPGKIQNRPDEVLFSNAMVAEPKHRAAAAAVDGLAVLLGTVVFVGAGLAAGVDLGQLGNLLLLPAAMTVVVAVLYRALWCVADCDTPGMRLTGLRLVDFDGRAPRRDKRIVRQFAGLLSVLSAGVGLVWALVDEESLTWHDHISKTFPTSA